MLRFHPSKRWLLQNDYNPAKAGCVEINNASNFLKWSAHQPAMVLHELAHAYHQKALTPELKQFAPTLHGLLREVWKVAPPAGKDPADPQPAEPAAPEDSEDKE